MINNYVFRNVCTDRQYCSVSEPAYCIAEMIMYEWEVKVAEVAGWRQMEADGGG